MPRKNDDQELIAIPKALDTGVDLDSHRASAAIADIRKAPGEAQLSRSIRTAPTGM